MWFAFNVKPMSTDENEKQFTKLNIKSCESNFSSHLMMSDSLTYRSNA